MHIHHDREPRSFGKRRVAVEAAGPERIGRHRPVGLVAWSLRVSAVIGFVAVAGAAQLARWNRIGDAPTRVAGSASLIFSDPETTGAIASAGAAGAARGTRLDPCLLPVSERLRP